jgi:hypothetical protein
MELHKCAQDRMITCYTFNKDEKAIFIKALKEKIKHLNRNKEAVWNNPTNEGQVIYENQIKWLNRDIERYEEIIKEFSK